MLRHVLFAITGIAIAACLALDRPSTATAADQDVSGNWVLSYNARAGFEQNAAIIRIEVKDGKPAASVVATPTKLPPPTISDLKIVDGQSISFNYGVSRFEGTISKAGNSVIGNFGTDIAVARAKLVRTEKTEFAANEFSSRVELPAPADQALKLTNAVTLLRGQAQREKDVEKRKELNEKAETAQKEADEKVPGLLREVVAKHSDSPASIDAATDLLRSGTKYKVTTEEVGKLLSHIEKESAPFGTRYTNAQLLTAIEAVASDKGLAGAAEATAEKLAKQPGASAEVRARILTVRKLALEALGKTEEAKAVAAELAKVEEQIDAEYMKKVPPFKPDAFAGRKDSKANTVAVMELFTGAQCPPCVAADVAFDALLKAYKPSDLVLIQYHLHIPGPDPLTNPDSVARARYYAVNSTPSTLFNGKPDARGGGGMAAAENKFKQYIGIINPILETSTDVNVSGQATRSGDKIDIAIKVEGSKGGELKLRILVVEENVKYIGSNQLRFHHHVVRAMPGGPDGVAIKEKEFKHTTSVDLEGVRNNLTKYLDNYATNTRPFPKPDRPMVMKAVKVIAVVQNDETKEIVQAVQLDVKAAGGGQ